MAYNIMAYISAIDTKKEIKLTSEYLVVGITGVRVRGSSNRELEICGEGVE